MNKLIRRTFLNVFVVMFEVGISERHREGVDFPVRFFLQCSFNDAFGICISMHVLVLCCVFSFLWEQQSLQDAACFFLPMCRLDTRLLLLLKLEF